MMFTKGKATITVDDKEYRAIKAFYRAIMKIYENDTCPNIEDIIKSVSYGRLDFEDFEIKIM